MLVLGSVMWSQKNQSHASVTVGCFLCASVVRCERDYCETSLEQFVKDKDVKQEGKEIENFFAMMRNLCRSQRCLKSRSSIRRTNQRPCVMSMVSSVGETDGAL